MLKIFDTRKIKKLAKKDFEKTWLETARLLKKRGALFSLEGKGYQHPVFELREKVREVLIELGFEEIMNPIFIDYKEIYKQYGPEAPVILDRLFYVAGLPRPDIGITKDSAQRIKKIADMNMNKLKGIFRKYKEGKIEGDNIVEEMVEKLKIKTEQATGILDIFPEFRKLKPVPTEQTLRSHMTAAWFLTLEALQEKKMLPLKLFSIDRVFRREQKQDKTHVKTYHSASIVIMAKNFSLEDGEKISRRILEKIGLKNIKFVTKKATSKYYAPEFEEEIYAEIDGRDVEVGDLGMYSPVALSNYGIKYPVFNVGFGIERIAMLLNNYTDIRELVHPQFYKAELTDKEISKMIRFVKEPKTPMGKEIELSIVNGIKKYKDEVGPKRFLVYENEKIRVYVSEPEAGKKLLGPAGMNEVYVYKKAVVGIDPKNAKYKEVMENGIRVTNYVEAIAKLFASEIESGKKGRFTIRIVDTLPSINLFIEPAAEKQVALEVKGPVFVDVEVEEK